jgi:hypothetical protein
MSVSASAHPHVSGRRRPFPYILLAALGALALFAALVAIAVSNNRWLRPRSPPGPPPSPVSWLAASSATRAATLC